MAASLRILLVDDDSASRSLLSLLIGARWPGAVLTEVSDALSLARAMRGPTQDLCIVDPQQNWADSNEFLQLLTEDVQVGPVVVYSSVDRAEPAMAALRAGAALYLVKDAQGPPRLLEEISQWLGPGTSDSSAEDGSRQALAMVSHDLQEPIRSVQNYLDVLHMKHGSELSKSAVALVEQASRATGRALDGLKQGLDELRPPAAMPEFTQADLPVLELDEDDESMESTTAWRNDVVRFPEVVTNSTMVLDETLEILASAIEQEDAEVLRDSLAPVAVQSGHLRRILQNLISNALKFRTEDTLQIQISSVEEDDLVRFRVQDNGIGIAEEEHQRIFQMFSRVHDGETFPGSGIGLAAAKNLVESYGGEIGVESALGEGACFIFTLPAIPGARVRASRKS
jgi:signal transduction histidine kinase